MTDLNYYRQVLNVTESSSIADIKKAYRKQAKQWHPDKFYSEPEKHKIAEEKFKEINLAYEYLVQQENKKSSTVSSNSSEKQTGASHLGYEYKYSMIF